MIKVDLPARMECAEEGCTTPAIPVELCLLATGGFGFKPEGEAAKDWQLIAQPNGVFTAFCPTHKKETQRVHTQLGPAGKRLYTRG